MFCRIESFPRCSHHIFLSHSREDHEGLVYPTFQALKKKQVIPWIDLEDYYYGRDSRTALKDGLLYSRHAVFFITDAMLNSTRGWCHFELAYAELIQSNLTTSGGPLSHILLPLFFVDQSDDRIKRSVWQAIRERGLFCDVKDLKSQIRWSSRQILRFLEREISHTEDLRVHLSTSATFRQSLDKVPGLLNRISKYQPANY